MTVKEVTEILEDLAPLPYAEGFDNVGLLVGDSTSEVRGILVTLDTMENVIDEAIEKKCNLIVSFHPIIFGGLKKITGKSYVERVVIKAIKNDIAIYSMHTALDNVPNGVNAKICDVLGIKNTKALIPQKGSIKKLTTYVPLKDADAVREAIFNAGAGNIGNYSNCSFNVNGLGSYKAGENAKPTLGEIGKTHYEEETQLNVTFSKAHQSKIMKALFATHPYEEVAYEISTLENNDQNLGMGMIGTLHSPMGELDFLKQVKQTMSAGGIRHSKLLGREIRRVAVLGGSGAFAIDAAKAAGADILITADIKYHEFYKAEDKIVIADIGHYESEQFTKNLLVDYLTKKIPNFAIRLSESKTNPIKYL
ncbi:Nif3-like dinuclear metal center hexameric protein [Zobellia galactanivorans]|uniref:Nif3-like dinuclear metal center hexameric protein n=1 Tax=Zobellia galactanivorans (strain DSM 12802 / CCUG 47099 / CIP 106680 / NCIMB 13871 / Dsij) TaxID=63186 RepID=UPI0026E18EEF|nr:Nif3-like dinuclear metal center hexameric protein [Zobellia galactanivorans]MDO6809551.1 Nif3-like dinuclear metal center hexameric protein [Zobellia galactanivorans]